MSEKAEKGTKQTKANKNRRKSPSDRVIEILDDPRQRKAATILAYAGYKRGTRGAGTGWRRSGALTNAARQAGVSIPTIYAWLEEPSFKNAVEEAQEELKIECFLGLRKAIRDANPTACIYLLKVLDAETFDDQFVRDAAKREHEIAMFHLAQTGGEQIAQLPDMLFPETAPGERLAHDPDDSEMH